jgi:hypothetical protein
MDIINGHTETTRNITLKKKKKKKKQHTHSHSSRQSINKPTNQPINQSIKHQHLKKYHSQAGTTRHSSIRRIKPQRSIHHSFSFILHQSTLDSINEHTMQTSVHCADHYQLWYPCTLTTLQLHSIIVRYPSGTSVQACGIRRGTWIITADRRPSSLRIGRLSQSNNDN